MEGTQVPVLRRKGKPPEPLQSSSTKAAAGSCDLCFTKKIKCDMLKPACSNCVLYKADCRTTAVRRRIPNPREREREHAPRPQPASVPAASGETPNPSQGLEDRLARIEAQLQQVVAVASAAVGSGTKIQQAAPATPALFASQDVTPAAPVLGTPAVDPALGLDSLLGGFSPETDWVSGEYQDSQYKLPPLDDILPQIESYFIHFNSVIPLFDQAVFMRMLHDYYHSPAAAVQESRYATWAAVNIVLALGHRMPNEQKPVTTDTREMFTENEEVSKCLANAQSVLSELVSRDQDTLGLQVLLGMVILFQSTRDHRPGPVLIGTAVRLAHRMKLHTRIMHSLFTKEEADQRTRLFWITYFLDRDISLRHQVPFLQQDNDIDVDLPSIAPTDGVGDISTLDGTVSFNYFRARVQLSNIQGRIYDMLYSARSTRLQPEQRRRHIARVDNLLEDWRRSIPSELQVENVVNNVGRMELTHMASLHHAYLTCLVMTHGIYSHSAAWIRRINQYSRTQLMDCAWPRGQCLMQYPPLPRSWQKCVSVSRECLKVLGHMSDLHVVMWLNGCAFMSALIILLVHIFESPLLETASLDKELTRRGLRVFNNMKTIAKLDPLDRLGIVVEELDKQAMRALEEAEQSPVAADTTRSESSSASGSAMSGRSQGRSLVSGPFGSTGSQGAQADMDMTEGDLEFGDWGVSMLQDMGFALLPKPFDSVIDTMQATNQADLFANFASDQPLTEF